MRNISSRSDNNHGGIDFTKPGIWPEINLAPQVLINENGGGSCSGGNSIGAYEYIYKNGIPDETCQIYVAHNNPHGSTNSSLNICENCVPGNSSSTFTPGVCSPVTNYTKYYVSEYGLIKDGTNGIKNEIFERGPVACGMDVTSEFEEYNGGVFSQNLTNVSINHEVSLFGWGVSSEGEDYWWGRNSWGLFHSFFFFFCFGCVYEALCVFDNVILIFI